MATNNTKTHSHASVHQHQGNDLAECRRERSVLRNDLLSPVQGSVRRMAQWDVIRSQWP